MSTKATKKRQTFLRVRFHDTRYKEEQQQQNYMKRKPSDNWEKKTKSINMRIVFRARSFRLLIVIHLESKLIDSQFIIYSHFDSISFFSLKSEFCRRYVTCLSTKKREINKVELHIDRMCKKKSETARKKN